MPDQADKLRSLVDTADTKNPHDDDLPLVVVSGGRMGVGATTVALNMAAVLADRGERVLLVDGATLRNLRHDSVVARQQVEFCLGDVLAGKCDIVDALVAGPAGVQMLINRATARSTPDYSRGAQQRLLSCLHTLTDCFDVMVVDAGSGVTPWSQRFWADARLIALVTTCDDAAVLDSYSTLKQGMAGNRTLPVRLLVNQAESDQTADDTHRRMAVSCHRFLSRSLPALPPLPLHADSDTGLAAGTPRVWEAPNSPFGHAAMWLGRAVSDIMSASRQDFTVLATSPDANFGSEDAATMPFIAS
jgi:flagellar biosynthesis protein FlhG